MQPAPVEEPGERMALERPRELTRPGPAIAGNPRISRAYPAPADRELLPSLLLLGTEPEHPCAGAGQDILTHF